MGSCFFIGHHDAGKELLPLLAEVVERHITEYGVTDFLWGITATLTAWRPMRSKKQKSVIRRYTLFWCCHTIRRFVPLKTGRF